VILIVLRITGIARLANRQWKGGQEAFTVNVTITEWKMRDG
jgi:hypothetical protein